MAGKRRSGTNAEFLESLEGSSARRSIKIVGEIRQENLERRRTDGACSYPFLKLRKQVIDEAVQIVGIVTIGVYSGFG